MKEVFGYLRVSGKAQVDGDGFDRQKDAINSFCKSRGWVCIRFFKEKGVSGTVESTDRPAFGEMLSLCGDSLPTTLVVERIDRLARDLIISELLFEQCRKHGVDVYAADTGEEYVHANSDPSRKLIRQVLGAVSEFIKSELVKKLRAARDRRRREHGRCEGQICFEDRPENRPIVDIILTARSLGQTFSVIAAGLNREFPARENRRPWSKATAHEIWTRAKKKGLTAPLPGCILKNITLTYEPTNRLNLTHPIQDCQARVPGPLGEDEHSNGLHRPHPQ